MSLYANAVELLEELKLESLELALAVPDDVYYETLFVEGKAKTPELQKLRQVADELKRALYEAAEGIAEGSRTALWAVLGLTATSFVTAAAVCFTPLAVFAAGEAYREGILLEAGDQGKGKAEDKIYDAEVVDPGPEHRKQKQNKQKGQNAQNKQNAKKAQNKQNAQNAKKAQQKQKRKNDGFADAIADAAVNVVKLLLKPVTAPAAAKLGQPGAKELTAKMTILGGTVGLTAGIMGIATLWSVLPSLIGVWPALALAGGSVALLHTSPGSKLKLALKKLGINLAKYLEKRIAARKIYQELVQGSFGKLVLAPVRFSLALATGPVAYLTKLSYTLGHLAAAAQALFGFLWLLMGLPFAVVVKATRAWASVLGVGVKVLLKGLVKLPKSLLQDVKRLINAVRGTGKDVNKTFGQKLKELLKSLRKKDQTEPVVEPLKNLAKTLGASKEAKSVKDGTALKEANVLTALFKKFEELGKALVKATLNGIQKAAAAFKKAIGLLALALGVIKTKVKEVVTGASAKKLKYGAKELIELGKKLLVKIFFGAKGAGDKLVNGLKKLFSGVVAPTLKLLKDAGIKLLGVTTDGKLVVEGPQET